MEDREIVALFYKRDEQAIRQCERQYGRLVRYVASRILDSESEAEDVAGDTWLKAWNAIPPATPEKLGTYLAMIARQTAIDRLRARQRISRGGGSPEDSVEELSEMLSQNADSGKMEEALELSNAISCFLNSLKPEERIMFMRRYWWGSSVEELAEEFRVSQSAVKMRLSRTRTRLEKFLRKEGYDI